ncbi:CU044_5270 family protein [Streptosporangium sp. NPDC051023]|uniref:CU044_5270 family protein n=1 Tax=Streptosporangium sp. NPDC051023 TaxID=3155410 RepID=UPI00344EA8D5
MDEITLLASCLPDAPPPAPEVVARARARLKGPGPRTARAGSRRWTPVAGLATATATVAVAVAVTVVVAGLGDAAPPTVAVPAKNGQILLNIADRVEKAPVETGAYWRRRSVIGSITSVDAASDGIGIRTDEITLWAPRESDDPVLVTSKMLRGRFLALPRGTERKPWNPAEKYDYKLGEALNNTCRYSWKVEPKGVLYDRRAADLTFADLEALPTDPAALLERLKILWADQSETFPASGSTARRGLPRDTEKEKYLSFAAVSLLNLPSPPALRAAALRILADRPGTEVVGEVVDALGRTEVAVRVNADEPSDAGIPAAYQVMVDPRTGELAGDRSVAVTDRGGLPRGTVLNYTAYAEQGWTGERPARPRGCERVASIP